MQTSLFGPSPHPDVLEDLFAAYYACRRNKRNTVNALVFERHLESNLFRLHGELMEGRYRPGRSLAFIIRRPVQREVFAADFRDRVVHHFLIGRLNPLFEDTFIDDSYACREGKGTHFGIRRLEEAILGVSANHARSAHVLQMDIRGFFMAIHRPTLRRRLHAFVHEHYPGTDRLLVHELIDVLLMADPARHCRIKGRASDWDGLPADKSLFRAAPGCGLPIGNLTSQIFANFYLHPFDRMMSALLPGARYGRYVDDFWLVHHDRDALRSVVPMLRQWHQTELRLTLHPRKVRLKEARKGVAFLGAFIKPGHVLPGRRVVGNFREALWRLNRRLETEGAHPDVLADFRAAVNSYLGHLGQTASYRLRKRLLFRHAATPWWSHFLLDDGARRLRPKRRPAADPGLVVPCRLPARRR